MKIQRHLLLSLFAVLISVACSDDVPLQVRPDHQQQEAPALTQKVNNFVVDYFRDAYLWNNTLPSDINVRYETDPIAFFDKLKYLPDDRWSYLTDDADALFNGYEGVQTSFGYSLALGMFSNTGNYFGIIQFVYPNTPAEKAGLKRGDLLVLMNDGDITEKNYMDLFNASTIKLSLGELTDEGSIGLKDQTVSMTALEMYLDPVNTYKVIEKGSKKIGYLCYTDYVPESHAKLAEVFSGFLARGVTDVVLDLRYNPGGASISAEYLSSLLAPAAVVNSKSVYLKHIWNDKYMAYFKQQGEDPDSYFDKTVPVNMNLNHLYVLTSRGTASASEATMVGLSSYLQLTQIGDTTHGKYCGALLLQPEIQVNGKWVVDKEIENWAMSLIVYRFANSNGVTDFKNGFVPDWRIDEDLFATMPFGDERDPLLAKAISLITGTPPVVAAVTRSRNHPPYKIVSGLPSRKSLPNGGMLDKRIIR